MPLTAIEKRLRGFRLRIHQPDHTPLVLGHGGPVIDWHLHEAGTLDHIVANPGQALGATYVQGQWDIDSEHLPLLITAVIPDQARPPGHTGGWLRRLRARLPGQRSRAADAADWRNRSVRIARLCLGEELFTGTACFEEPGVTLEQAQRARGRRLIEDLQLQPGQHVLDLDAGWGSTALLLAEQAAVRVTALFSTPTQLDHARREARNRRLHELVLCRLGDMNQCRGHFDRILSSGMNLQASAADAGAQLRRLGELLHDDGFIWMQRTGRRKDHALANQWLQQQIPSQNRLPLLSGLTAAIESTPLHALQISDLSAHHERTINAWRRRFRQHRNTISRLYGETDTRRWEFRLASEEAALQHGQLSCYQVLLGNPRSVWPNMDTGGHASDHLLPLDLDQALTRQERDG